MKNVSPGPFDGSLRDTLFSPADFGGMLAGAFATVLRHWLVLAAFLAASVLLSIYYLSTTTPKYTATGSMLIDPRVGDTPNSRSTSTPGLLVSDALTVDSEIQVLTSREVTANAARILGLGEAAADAEEATGPGPLDWLRALMTPQDDAEPLPEDVEAQRAFETIRKQFAEGLSVQRAGETFVIDLAYTSTDLAFAPEAVNTVMREYLKVSTERRLKNTENTRDWLASRIEEVASDLEAAEKAAAEFQLENSLLAPAGELLSMTSVLTASDELNLVENEILALRVNVDHMTELLETGDLDAIDIPAEDRSLTALVEYESLLAEQLFKEQELLLRYEPDSEVMTNNRLIQERTRDLIATELTKVRDRMLTELEVLELRAEETRGRIAKLTEGYGADLVNQVTLRNLERTAAAKRLLYTQLNDEFDQTTQLLTYDIVDAQVIGWAVVPSSKSSPKSAQILVLAVFGALVLGLTAIFLIDDMDNRFRSASDVRTELGLDLIGLIPKFSSDIKKRRGAAALALPKPKLLGKARRLPKNLYFAVLYPASITAQTLRALHVELSFSKSGRRSKTPHKVVGFTSSGRNEGKTTTAINFATFLAHRGESVVLLDLDFLAFNMSRLLRPTLSHENKLMELIAGPADMAPELKPIPTFPNLYFVGAVSQQPIGAPTPRELDELETVIEVLKGQFDMVVVDLPPLRGVSETQLLANLCDRAVFLIDWSTTSKEAATNALRKWVGHKDKLLGALYTKARLSTYESFNKHEIHDYFG